MSIEPFLATHGISYASFEHPAVFTCEESALLPPMPGADTKNLFLRDKKGKRHFLVCVGHGKTVDLKALKILLQADALSFASDERLLHCLGVTPGSVTLLGLMNDPAHAVEVVIDAAIWNAPAVQCHPLRNTATFVIPHEGLDLFLQKTGHRPIVIPVPARRQP